MNIKKWIRSALLCVLMCVAYCSNGQDLLKGNDLSQIKADQLSDADIARFYKQLQASGLTLAQAEQLAMAKGMPATEIAKLKQRLQQLSSGSGETGNSISSNGNVDRSLNVNDSAATDLAEKKSGNLMDPDIFGSELFNNSTLNSQANFQMATPINYELGPGDELQIAVFGVQEMSTTLGITAEGIVSIPNVGQLKLAGSTIEAATQRIRNAMAAGAYPTLRSGTSKLSVTLGNKIRSIHITVIGANRPGNYTLSSLSTTFNALYMAGGPSPYGSFREIELIRDNKIERKIDLYHFLVKGDQQDNVRLRDNDVIRIPAYKKRMELRGQIKRPGIFELLDGENFNNVLEFASGFTDTAYKASVKVTQLTDKERRVKDLQSTEYPTYIPMAGDIITVSEILNRFMNRVNITGAVFRPGYFELSEGMTVADLIRKADGLKEDAYTGRAQLVRLKENLTKEIIPFNVQQAMSNNAIQNIVLKREDEIVITSIFDLRDEYKVTVQGEIRVPGEYMYVDSLSLKDLIILAGGFTDAAKPQKIEISRMLIRDTLTSVDERASEVIEINNIQDLSLATGNIQLAPFDVVTVRRKPGYIPLTSVQVSGQVQYPGPYVISRRSERISDLIKRAGSFTPEAYIEGAYLKRHLSDAEIVVKRERISRLQENMLDTSARILQDFDRKYDQIPLDLEMIMNKPGSAGDLIVKADDELYIPKFDAQVRINGGVLMPTQIPFRMGYRVRDYLSAAGGVSQDALRRKIYVLYANGRASSTRHFLFFKKYPRVKPGAEIIVPKKLPKPIRSSTETIGLASVFASLAGVIIAIINVTK